MGKESKTKKKENKTFKIKKKTWKVFLKGNKLINKRKELREAIRNPEKIDLIELSRVVINLVKLDNKILKVKYKFWNKVYKELGLSIDKLLETDYKNKRIILRGKRK